MGFIDDIKANWRFLLPFYVGIFRWAMFIVFKVIPALLYRQVQPKDLDRETGRIYYRPSDVTVVVPVYQPGPSFPDNMASLAQKSPNTLIAVADVTCFEDTCAIFRKVQELYPNVNCRVLKEYKPGKRPALVAGLKETRTSIIAFVDDDTQWIPMDFLPNLILPFSYDERCGGVGCKQVMRPKGKRADIFEIVSDMRLSARYIEIRATTLVDKCCSCISGRTMAFRTNIIQNEEFYDFFLNEKFFGMQLQSGDDKALTRYLISNDYKQYHQLNNDCKLTTTFESGMRFIKQNIRWSRNTFRSDFAALFIERRIWRRDKFTAIVLFDKMFIPFFMMYGLLLVPILAIVQRNHIMFILWVIWLLFSRMIKLCYYLVEKPWRVLSMPYFIVWQYIAAVIKIYAMVTCYNRTWGTRDITVKDGVVMRTKEGAANAATLLADSKSDADDDDSGDSGDALSSSEYTDTGSGTGDTGSDKAPVHRIPFHLHPSIERDDFGRGHVVPPVDGGQGADEVTATPVRKKEAPAREARKSKDSPSRKSKDASGRKSKDGSGQKSKDGPGRKSKDDAGRKSKDDSGRKSKDYAGRKSRDDAGRKSKERKPGPPKESPTRKAPPPTTPPKKDGSAKRKSAPRDKTPPAKAGGPSRKK